MADESEVLPELDAGLAELVAAYRAETVREPAQVEAALQNVVARVGGGAAAAGGLSIAAKLGLVTLAVAAVVGVGALAWGPNDRDAEVVAPAPAEDPTPMRVSASTRGSVAPVVEPSRVDSMPSRESTETPSPEPAATSRATASRESKARRRDPPTPDVAPTTEAVVRVDPTPAPDVAPEEPAAPESTLRAELELLREARAALRRGGAREALATIDRHRKTYPSSTLAEERDATEISALCALGRVEEARRKAEAFGRRFGGSTRDLLGDCEARP